MLEEQNDNLPQADGQNETEVSNTNAENITIEEEVIIETTAEVVKDSTNNKALEDIENSNAEESEDDSVSEKHAIPMLEYDSMTMESLVEELEKLVTNEKVMAIKEHVEEIRKSFMSQYHNALDEKREEFAEQNEGETTGFEFHSP